MPARRTNPPPHDKFNAEGIQVKNAKGTVWFAKGDGSLAGSPEDTVKTPGSGSWRPIEEGAKDPKVFEAVWTETMTGSGRVFYDLVKGYVGKAGGLAGSIIKMKALRAWEGAKRKVRGAIDTVKETGAAALEKGQGRRLERHRLDRRALGRRQDRRRQRL